mgnify:FL=1
MKIYRSFDEAKYDRNTVLTLGTFDGVHRGHQVLIRYLSSIAARESLRPMLMTIDPHPQIVLKKPGKPPIELLTTINERIDLFEKFGVENLLIIPFSYEFSRTSPDEFVREFLFRKVGLRKFLIGYDHLFGKNRSGDGSLLDDMGIKLGFDVEQVQPFFDDGTVISSTKIRKSIKGHEIEKANEMLGYPYRVTGKVVRGQGRARSLGYPTANIMPEDNHKLYPGFGVYLVSSYIDNVKYFGMANIGLRPTLTEDKTPTLEVNFFNLDMDLYDKILQISFISFIRKEKKFDGVTGLLDQIAKDKESCMKMIKEL